MTAPAFDDLAQRLRGALVLPSDDGYDAARTVYNAMIDKRPAAVVQAANVADVMAAVAFAADGDLPVAVRGGGHSVPGYGTADDALVVDLGRMRGIRVDPAAKTVRAEGGCTWGDLNHTTHAFGLGVTGGIISTTGIGGLTLGGGIGHLARGAGLSCDNLISADVVLADGSFVTCSEEEHADLFWALRGGGGNFGVVTAFEYRLHDVGDVVGGVLFFEVEHAEAVLRAWDAYIDDAPEALGAFFAWQIAPPMPFIDEDRHGDVFCVLAVCWNGPPEGADKALAPLRDAAPVAFEHVGPMPYPALNAAFDDLVPPGLQHYWKAAFVSELTDDAVAAHLAHGPKVPVVNSTMHIYPINGACHRVGADATAFGHRGAKYATVIAGMWPDPSDNEANIAWVKDYYAAIAPHSEAGAYINFASADDQERVRANFGANVDRLVEVKSKYDPDNRFRFNQNLPPKA